MKKYGAAVNSLYIINIKTVTIGHTISFFGVLIILLNKKNYAINCFPKLFNTLLHHNNRRREPKNGLAKVFLNQLNMRYCLPRFYDAWTAFLNTITGTSFPELSVLELSASIDCDLTILLLSHQLKKVTMNINYSEGKDCVLSVSAMHEGNLQRSLMWLDHKHGYEGQLYCSDTSISRLAGTMMAEFTFASVEKLSYSFNE
jgi:hypothetical protein